MRQQARRGAAAVVLVVWAAAVAVGAPACGGEVPADEAPAAGDASGPQPPATTPPDPGVADVDAVETPAAPSPDEGGEVEQTENGQTGSLAPWECIADTDCIPPLEALQGGDAEYVLLDSGCEHGSSGLPPYRNVSPVCVCDLSVTQTARYRGNISRQTTEELVTLGFDARLGMYSGYPQCLVSTAIGECGYCDYEFPGCDINLNDCAAQCADAVEQMRAAERVAHDVELRTARCTDTGSCEIALRVDDDCYNQHGVRSSCALSDDAIIAASGDGPNPGEQCVQPPLPCDSAEDCPNGLACNGSVCGVCLGPDDGCSGDETGACINADFVCADGEACISGFCVSAERAECVSFADCSTTDPDRDPRVCLLDSVDTLDGRGNAQTRSFCTSFRPNAFGLRIGDVLEVRVLGPADAVASAFEPPLSNGMRGCGESSGLSEGTALRLRIEQLSSAFVNESGYWPAASLLDDEAPIEAVPAPVHPRDSAAGRQLWNVLSSPSNHDPLAFLAPGEPTTLQGCPGTRDLWLTSLLDRLRPGEPARQDGTFPTTLLQYRFAVSEESVDDPACAVFPEFGCADALQVEVRRLTP